jgi:hypothetical protein
MKLFVQSLSSHRPAYQSQHNFLNLIPKTLLHFSTNQDISDLPFMLHPYIILGSLFIDLCSIGTQNLDEGKRKYMCNYYSFIEIKQFVRCLKGVLNTILIFFRIIFFNSPFSNFLLLSII